MSTKSLCAAAQSIMRTDGSCYGWELLARHDKYPISAGARPILDEIDGDDDWLSLDLFMLDQAVVVARQHDYGKVAVNVSVSTLSNLHSLNIFLKQCLRTADLVGKDRLCIEINEQHGRTFTDLEHLIGVLHQWGCLVAIDDFPTAITQRVFLSLPWDVVKLSCGTGRHKHNLATLKALNSRPEHLLRPFVVAEHPEPGKPTQRLVRAGVNAIQSFGHGEPMPVVVLPSVAGGN